MSSSLSAKGLLLVLLGIVAVHGAPKLDDKAPAKTPKNDYGNPWTDKQVIELLLKRYRFPESSSNVSVSVLVEVEQVDDVHDDKCHLTLLVVQKWVEETLKYTDIRDSLSPVKFRTLNYIWNPALTVDNAVSMTPVGKDSIRVFGSGLVEYSHRVKLAIPSQHSLKSFPFETRNCTIRFTNDDSRASWSRLLRITLPGVAEGTSEWLTMPNETVSNYHNLRLKMRRSVDNWVFTFFLPTFGLVLASWVPVWMNTQAQLSRTSIGAVSFFSILMIVLSKKREIPTTPYLKAVDYWSLAVSVFSFLFFLQSALTVSHANGRHSRKKSYDSEEEKAWLNVTPYYSVQRQRSIDMARICDYIFRIVAPVCFGVFVGIFVVIYVFPFWNISI